MEIYCANNRQIDGIYSTNIYLFYNFTMYNYLHCNIILQGVSNLNIKTSGAYDGSINNKKKEKNKNFILFFFFNFHQNETTSKSLKDYLVYRLHFFLIFKFGTFYILFVSNKELSRQIAHEFDLRFWVDCSKCNFCIVLSLQYNEVYRNLITSKVLSKVSRDCFTYFTDQYMCN